jgi:mono/diheme cytochrome c family protein
MKYKNFYTVSFVVFLVGISSLVLTGYRDYRHEVSGLADSLLLGSFVEQNFPYIPTSIDARKLGPSFPDHNMAARALALRLGDSAYVCFDTDMLRWSVAWTGPFLPMSLMAQVSYKDFFNKGNKITTVTGKPQIATGQYPGWSSGQPVFEDVRPAPELPDQPKWGAMPAAYGRWEGVYTYGGKAILNYTVDNIGVAEMVGAARFGDQTAFTRTLRVEGSAKDLFLTAAEIKNATRGESGKAAFLYQGVNKDTITAVGFFGKPTDAQTVITSQRYLSVRFPARATATEVTVVIWRGPATKRREFEKFCKSKRAISFPDFKKGGSPYWSQEVVTSGKLSPDTAAYVTDELALPLPNLWKRNVRVADIAFFKDGRAAVVTFEGDVWLIKGIDKGLQKLTWTRFASGIHEPMSIEIVKEQVFVFGREGIVKIHDLNGDGSADYYENFSNVMIQSAESREWAADMVYGPDGCFYVAKGGSQSNGPGITSQVAKGFRAGSEHNGTVLKISKDGRSAEIIATGLRAPYLGMHPEKGILTASDQQGNFVPSTPIYLIKKGDFFGVPPTRHRADDPGIAAPLTWIPHRVDRSSISQAWITGNKMGPLNDNMIHFSFARPGLFRVLIDSTSGVFQGGVSFINARYPAPTSKGAVSPLDGQLYVTGFNLWGSSSTGVSALIRLRYTGKPSFMPNHFQALKEGVILGFDCKLDPAQVNPAHFQVKRWNYKRTQEYGSGHFKLDGSTGEDVLSVAAAHLSADGKKVLLLVPGMAQVMQMEVGYDLKSSDGALVKDFFWFTVNEPGQLNPFREEFKNVDLAVLSVEDQSQIAPKAEDVSVSATKGKELFTKMACAGCHSEGLKTDGMYGPPFQNLYKTPRQFEDGSTTIADDSYIRESILTPSVRVVKGYNSEMPSFSGILTDSDIESITLYIKSLRQK